MKKWSWRTRLIIALWAAIIATMGIASPWEAGVGIVYFWEILAIDVVGSCLVGWLCAYADNCCDDGKIIILLRGFDKNEVSK